MGGSPVGLWFCKSALPTDLLPSFSEIPAACVGLLFFPLSTLPLASLAVLAFGIITITWWLSGIEASFKVLCKHCMISLARRIFSPSIEKGPHKKEWFWQARWHKNILNGPPSSVLLWPQADGLGKQGEGKHVWHLPWDAFSVAPEQVWLAHWGLNPAWECRLCVMEVDFLWPGLGASAFTQVFSPCYSPLIFTSAIVVELGEDDEVLGNIGMLQEGMF